MVTVPDLIVRRIYVRGSLVNTESGFLFKLRNNLAQGNLTGAGSLSIDGTTVAGSSIVLHAAAGSMAAADVSPSSPLNLPLGVELTIEVRGKTLDKGRHEVHFPVTLKETGPVSFEVSDEVH